MSVTKAELRRDLLLRRDELEPAWRAEASERIMERVLGLPQVAAVGHAFGPAAFPGHGRTAVGKPIWDPAVGKGGFLAAHQGTSWSGRRANGWDPWLDPLVCSLSPQRAQLKK